MPKTAKTQTERCPNSRTRQPISLQEADRGSLWCSWCGQMVNIRVHRPKCEGDAHEGTLMAHNVAQKAQKKTRA